MHLIKKNRLMKISEFIFRIAEGLLYSIICLSISFLGSFLSVYWDWENGIFWVCGIVSFITYCCIVKDDTTLNIVLVFTICIPFSVMLFDLNKLWFYILINSIICLGIVITCIRNYLNPNEY